MRVALARKQQGFSLIEVLISMIIFMVGILGVIGMQGQAFRVTHDNMQRYQAAWLSYELLERVRLNPDGLRLATGNYQAELDEMTNDRDAYCITPPAPQCIGQSCSVAQMVAYDVFDLVCQRNVILNLQVELDCTPDATCPPGSILVTRTRWNMRGGLDVAALGAWQEMRGRLQ